LEYQNKCLATKIENLNEKLNEKTNYANLLEKRIEAIAKAFIEINSGMFNLSEEIRKMMLSINDEAEANFILSNNPSNVSGLIKIIAAIIKDTNESREKPLNSQIVDEQVMTLINEVSDNVINIVKYIISSISYQNELKNLIETKLDSSKDKISEKITNENKKLKAKNEELVLDFQANEEKCKQYQRELQALRLQQIMGEDQIKEQNEKIKLLNDKVFSLTRKVNTNPALPYIYFEKSIFNKVIDTHQCICHICGNEINTLSKPQVDPENVIMSNEPVVNNEDLSAPNEEMLALNNENERLKSRIAELIEYNEKMKLDCVLTENKILSSKAFKSLYSQAEALLKQLEDVKEANYELQKQKYEFVKEKENELKQEEKKFLDSKNELEQKNIDLYNQNISNNLMIDNLNIKIQHNENLVKSKNSLEIELVFENFNQEKQKWTKQLELIKQQKKEYQKKFVGEFEKNSSNEKYILKLKSEIEKLTQNLLKYENPEKEEKYEKNDMEERKRMKRDLKKQEERIISNEKEIKELKSELNFERENGEKLISELEVNEKGLDDLNKKIKNLIHQLQETNEKIAKMTNEKIKDMYTIKLLNEQKEILEKRIKEQETIIVNYQEYTKKQEINQNSNKEILLKLEQEFRMKEEELNSIRSDIKQSSKVLEQNKIAYEETLKALNESQKSLAKSLANYEQMKVRYEELCKIKNIQGYLNEQSYDEIKQENEVLKLENDKYRVSLIKIIKTIYYILNLFRIKSNVKYA
jgi:hypothetical protein